MHRDRQSGFAALRPRLEATAFHRENRLNIDQAQQDMRAAYAGGSTGIFASAIAWFASGVVASGSSPKNAVLALLVAGMFIYPASVLLSKALGRTGSYRKGNPFASLAMESTGMLIFALPIAYLVSLHEPRFFYPTMMLIIGGRYLVFSTLYGSRLYWALGVVLAVAAYALVVFGAAPHVGAFVGAAVEAVFSVLVYILAGARHQNNPVTGAA